MSEGAEPKTARRRAKPKAAPPAENLSVADSVLAQPTAPIRRGGLRRLVWLAVAVVVVFATGVALWPVILPRLGADAPGGIMVLGSANLDARFSGLSERLDALDNGAADAEASRAAAAQRLDSLTRDREAGEASTAEVAARANAALAQALSLKRRTDELERAGAVLESLSERLTVLETALAEAAENAEHSPDSAAVAALAWRLDRVETAASAGDPLPQVQTSALVKRLGAVEAALADALNIGAAITELGEGAARFGDRLRTETARIAALEAAAAVGDPRRINLVLAIGRLRQALSGSGPYGDDLALVAELGAGDDALAAPLDVLAAHADIGVPARSVLRTRFAAVARGAVRANGDAEDGDWLDQTIARLSRLVSVRRTGEVAGAGTGAVLARAEARLATDDLAAAVAEIGALQGSAAEAASDWLGDAAARLAAERALDDLATTVAAR